MGRVYMASVTGLIMGEILYIAYVMHKIRVSYSWEQNSYRVENRVRQVKLQP